MDEAAARQAFDFALRHHEPAFERFFLARFFGLAISYGEGTCIVEFDVKDYMYNPQGSLHGGVIATALDISMGHLIKRTTGHGGATLELKTQYMRRVTAGRMRCEARYLKQGRSVSYLETRMWDGEGKLAAVTTATFQVRAPDEPAAATSKT
jgi:uncharacterized protein (TIGR00369 family)